jgi:hypothetical protein
VLESRRRVIATMAPAAVANKSRRLRASALSGETGTAAEATGGSGAGHVGVFIPSCGGSS